MAVAAGLVVMRILPPPQSPAAIEALEHMRALRRARQREADVAASSPAVTDEVANRDPLTAPLVVTPPRPLLPWPLRALGVVVVIVWGLSCAAAALGVAAFAGFALVVAVIALAAWVPVPISAAVIGVVLFLGAWAVWVR